MSFTPVTNMLDTSTFDGGRIGAAIGGVKRRNKLGELAGAYYGAQDEAGKQQAIDGMSAFDPASGALLRKEYASEQDEMQDKAIKAASYVLSALKLGDSSAVEGAYQAVRPFLERIGKASGKVPPPNWSPDMEPMLHQIVAPTGGVGGGANVQSTYVRQDGMRVAIMRDGSQRELGMAENRQQFLDMGDRFGVGDARAGTIREAGATMQPTAGALLPSNNAPTQATASNGQIIQLDPDLPPELRAQIAANPDAFEASATSGQPFTPQTVAQPATYQTPRKGMSPQAQAAEARAAIDDARADRTEQRQWRADQRDEARFQREQAKPAASPAMQKEAAARRAKIPQLQNAIRGLGRIEQALGALSGRMVNTGPMDAVVQRYTPQGQELEAAVGAIQNSVLALTRVPGIGAQSDLEARIAALQYPSLDKPPEVNRRTLEQLKFFMRDLAKAYESAAQDDASTPAARPASQPTGNRLRFNPATGDFE